ncbi:MAG: phosphoribosylanthranilate isomerase [Saprospiraceae bacterium]|jgi:phosphoribosylanthranilate isomerase
MVVKVCGIKTKENIEFISKLKIDMIGLNFYPSSIRYIDSSIPAEYFDIIPKEMKRVGVFVNESLENIENLASKFHLDYIQLHGDEDIAFCKSVAAKYKIIKVFRVDKQTDFTKISAYSFANYYLFDTATKHFGGSGKKFDWSKLDEYKDSVPFLLSGGIGPKDIDALSTYIHPQYQGIDINSKFESSPGIKDSDLLISFTEQLLQKK